MNADTNKIGLIRTGFPNICMFDIKSELPKEINKETKKVQKVIIDDPRTCIDRSLEKGIIRILRVIDYETVGCTIIPRKIIEVIKEYSYDEWDKYIKEIT